MASNEEEGPEDAEVLTCEKVQLETGGDNTSDVFNCPDKPL